MIESNHDYLTGLYTRQHLYNLYNSLEAGSNFHLMFVDLDNFKNVNDVYGHNEGDELLKKVAYILQSSAPKADPIRIGGDEFLLFFRGEYSREDLSNIANDIIFRIHEKEGYEHISTSISASIGILYSETIGNSLNDILLKSDRAMYYAKSHGKGCFVIYNDIEDEMMSEIYMEQMQQTALNNGEFEIRYMPVISAQTSRLRMTQIRIFWNMANGTVKSQEEFLPLFEKNGFIRKLNMWSITTTLSNIKRYYDNNQPLGRVCIRVSKLLLLETSFADTLSRLCNDYEISPSDIYVEIDDGSFTRGSHEMFSTMQMLKEKGFCISIVGVGSDFKSLAYWDKLDFDCIMFDSEYIKSTLSTPRGKQIFITLLSMGRQLKMQIIADGLENRDDVLFLCSYGCNAISGPYYSDALTEDAYFEYIQDKLVLEEEKIEFALKYNYISNCEKYTGTIKGNNILFAPGISDKWGSLYFPGGSTMKNYLTLPGSILSESWTICMWLKPTDAISWTSAFYGDYNDRFVTLSPFVVGNLSIFRISDGRINGYQDILARQLSLNEWMFVCLTYDELSGIARYYLDGKNTGIITDVPSLPTCQRVVFGSDAFQPAYQGYISGIKFFNQAKSEEEIVDIYNTFCNEPGFCGEVVSIN